jgi:hypothetical protein
MFACYDKPSMDEQSPLFARSRATSQRSITRRFARRITLAATSVAPAAALLLLLAGCSEDRVQQLEERVKLVEAKADSADKRSKAAEAMAADTPQIAQPEPVPQTDLASSEEDPATDVNGDGDPAAPPPPADNGKPAA